MGKPINPVYGQGLVTFCACKDADLLHAVAMSGTERAASTLVQLEEPLFTAEYLNCHLAARTVKQQASPVMLCNTPCAVLPAGGALYHLQRAAERWFVSVC